MLYGFRYGFIGFYMVLQGVIRGLYGFIGFYMVL